MRTHLLFSFVATTVLLTCSGCATALYIGGQCSGNAKYIRETNVKVFGNILNGGTIVKADAGDAIVQVLLWMLTGLVVLSLMLLLFETTKSSALCYIAALLFWTKMIEELIIQLFYFLLKIDTVGRYLIIYGNVWENSGTAENFIRNALYLAVFGAAALIIAKKSDVR